MTDPVNLPALREAVALLAKPGRLEISAVFKPFVREQDVFVRSEDGSFGLRLVRPETGEEAVLDFNALPALLDEVEALTGRTCRRCDKWDECGEDGQGECQFFGVHTREDFTCGAWAAKEQG